ncbi:5'-3' exonuclease [Peribacillus huizhouensis]|uniref:5'-3' exonuclease n=1 Tax=Peribacillus huizhouensis TaxID=1501239 RepID=A0ABR6CRU0_9BACI|nr:5'-3' exonuclease H3TH domain-containing protein [Peribacillus huizhouensis]MBA9027749.1 5'-3' exonuclease [Peribacillus huizhouensis]
MDIKEREQLPSFLLVDGMALLFRAFYATAVTGQFMINSKGVPTNAVQGFLKHMLMAIDHFSPSHVAVCWDMGSKTFRNDLFPDYKANRSEAPIEMVPQFELAKEAVEAFNIPNIGVAGYEADDCIGTIAKLAMNESHVSILTGDQDMLQLIDDRISVVLLKKGYGNYEVHNGASFFEWKGITPKQMIDLKALMGDTADNYPGVKGIGEKTALKLLIQYENIEGILNNIALLTKAQQTKIQAAVDMLHLSRQLAEIKCDVPVSCALETSVYRFDHEKVRRLAEDHEFKTIQRII